MFVTIKGYYFRAEICGRLVTWLMPHRNGPQVIDSAVDMNLVSTFALFYTTALGFVNFKLYNSIGLNYPPEIGDKSGNFNFKS